MKLCYYQLLDFRQEERENFMKDQGVRVHIKVKNHWSKSKDRRTTKNNYVVAAVLQHGFRKAILRMEAYNSLQGRALLHGDVRFVGFYQVEAAIAGEFLKIVSLLHVNRKN